jgi:hypothetical protein
VDRFESYEQMEREYPHAARMFIRVVTTLLDDDERRRSFFGSIDSSGEIRIDLRINGHEVSFAPWCAELEKFWQRDVLDAARRMLEERATASSR